MSAPVFRYMGRDVPFRLGESVAAALDAAGIADLGRDALGMERRYFCGIGACQGCLALVDGVVRETCLAPAMSGSTVERLDQRHD
jgi:aerobic-type carbon monoxide dehydrogenase small subunit (CoxS/CutS family)